MDVLILEDLQDQVNALKQALLRSMPQLSIAVMRSESEFVHELPKIASNPPKVAILDRMLPWGTTLPKPPRADALQAGIRCAKRLRADKRTADAAVVLHTFGRPLGGMPAGVDFIEKGDTAPVVAYVRSVLGARGESGVEPRFAHRCFVIHGHDEAALNEVVRTMFELNVKPIVLKDTPPSGIASILEHLEQNAQVDYAVAIMTPDDLGTLRGREKATEPRARQNVIFELGYFLGRLDRNRVTILTRGKVRQPSDLAGVIWIEMDKAGAWKTKLGLQMSNAGLQIDRALY